MYRKYKCCGRKNAPQGHDVQDVRMSRVQGSTGATFHCTISSMWGAQRNPRLNTLPEFRVTASGLRDSRSINLSVEVNILSEGVNNKISVLQRQAYDHHNEDCLIPEIIAAFFVSAILER
ncbi:MAG: hypothetical protein BMS9Abin11_1385 [Gammaproteobacteria bacterium]|nr:MAG: hypothetical protein BMS9Abin11_1385 [Gammaproteobacteria bacterium]